mgnify:CR=1 FL=1
MQAESYMLLFQREVFSGSLVTALGAVFVLIVSLELVK